MHTLEPHIAVSVCTARDAPPEYTRTKSSRYSHGELSTRVFPLLLLESVPCSQPASTSGYPDVRLALGGAEYDVCGRNNTVDPASSRARLRLSASHENRCSSELVLRVQEGTFGVKQGAAFTPSSARGAGSSLDEINISSPRCRSLIRKVRYFARSVPILTYELSATNAKQFRMKSYGRSPPSSERITETMRRSESPGGRLCPLLA